LFQPENAASGMLSGPDWVLRKVFNENGSLLPSMKVLVVGSGNIGSVAAADLARSVSACNVVVSDKNDEAAKTVAESIGASNVSWIRLDVANYDNLVKTLEDFDLAMGFLPGKLGYRLIEGCIDARVDLVDVSFMPENPLTLNRRAEKAGVAIVPDCGLAPGISNVLVGHAAGKLDKVHAVHIMVGGLPEKPVPPLGYVITWSPESLIDEYTRRAGIVEQGRIHEVDALSGVEEVEFSGVGRLEAFFTDGLRTLLHTVKNVDEMWEKTLRYPGHAEKVGLLAALGFFEDSRVEVEGASVSPRKLTVKLLFEKLWRPEVKDIAALKVEVSGVKKGKPTRYVYQLLDRYDEKSRTTAMARTTAYPASIVARLMLNKAVKMKGVVPPERLGMDEGLFKSFSDGLNMRGISVREEQIAS
jgi:saccharopine dehydrogenase-like NADP-dependent oxidoreductase